MLSFALRPSPGTRNCSPQLDETCPFIGIDKLADGGRCLAVLVESAFEQLELHVTQETAKHWLHAKTSTVSATCSWY